MDEVQIVHKAEGASQPLPHSSLVSFEVILVVTRFLTAVDLRNVVL
jgi:hypothetical protein